MPASRSDEATLRLRVRLALRHFALQLRPFGIAHTLTVGSSWLLVVVEISVRLRAQAAEIWQPQRQRLRRTSSATISGKTPTPCRISVTSAALYAEAAAREGIDVMSV